MIRARSCRHRTRSSEADVLIIESTYGNRRRDRADPEPALAEVIKRTVARGGSVIVPAFAVGRTQLLLHHLHRLIQQRPDSQGAGVSGLPAGDQRHRGVCQSSR
jgi:Cft2 family RNA processing exonuclease